MNEITASPDQAPLFDAVDAGIPALMERDGKRYYVVAEDRLEAFVSFIAPRIRARTGPVVIPGFAMAGDAIRALKAG